MSHGSNVDTNRRSLFVMPNLVQAMTAGNGLTKAVVSSVKVSKYLGNYLASAKVTIRGHTHASHIERNYFLNYEDY